MDRSFSKVLKISDEVVIPLGKLGCFDEHGIFPMNVIRKENQVYGYTSGISRRVSVPVETAIGLAISNDNGLTFEKVGDGPILSSSLHEPFLVCDPFVANFGNQYHMWYIYGTKWISNKEKDGAPSRVYKIAHALSNDGISWLRDGRLIISDALDENECQALPSVIYNDGLYHMIFCYREAIGFRNVKGRGYRLGYAYSNDLVSWIREDANIGIGTGVGSWDSDMLCYPHLFHFNEKIYLLYNGNEFGRFGFGLAILEN
jgi:sucrose-6-phosphate hydrolase SacC (GH32 family)